MGEADTYFNPNQQGNPPQYGQQQPVYGQGYNGNGNGNGTYQQPPPQQQQYQQNGYAPPQAYDGEKYNFDQTFKIEKPKYNDLWAGILVCDTMIALAS